MYVCTYTLPLVRKRVLEIMFDARSVDRAVVVPIFGTMSPTRLKRPATSHAHSDSESWVEFFRRQKLLFASFIVFLLIGLCPITCRDVPQLVTGVPRRGTYLA